VVSVIKKLMYSTTYVHILASNLLYPVKIQEKWFNALTDFEKAAVECLKVPTADIDRGVHNEEPSNLSKVEKIKAGKRKQRDVSMSEYMDADFILAKLG
jgi:hypothetical protein